ncbi:MAG: acyl-homoserine-lactone acylase [Myxococcota bacterium]|jgi:acyl-homoserine-lactone acylase
MRGVALLALLACGQGGGQRAGDDPIVPAVTGPTAESSYTAEIRWTSYGVPHVLAEDYGSLGFGYGYALARDHVCLLADQFVKIRAQRARYFGPGDDDANLESDFGWKALGLVQRAEAGLYRLPVDAADIVSGYASGYNHYLEEVGQGGLPPQCRGAEWVTPITSADVLAYQLYVGQLASGGNLAREVGQAQPPGLRAPGVPAPGLDVFAPFAHQKSGSNGWALGRNATEERRGAVLSNTHLPLEGERQWHELHLTIPGVLDVYGAALVGVPAVMIGFNERVAWTTTTSPAPRLTMYALTLSDDDPTLYMMEGNLRRMDGREYTIEVLQPDGSVRDQERTLWSTHWGPVFNAPLVGWTDTAAITWRDANIDNLSMVSLLLHLGRADDVESFVAGHARHQATPWMHTLYADADGTAWYAETSPTPNLSPVAENGYQDFLEEDSIASAYADMGVVLLPGNDVDFEWIDSPDAVRPGIVPFDRAPILQREDFVANANMGPWLVNPLAPLEDVPLLYGAPGEPLTARTRTNLMLLTESSMGAGPDALWSLDELEGALFGAESSLAIRLAGAVGDRCDGVEEVRLDEGTVSIDEACAVLGAWDGSAGLDARGAVLWREFLSSDDMFTPTDLVDAGALFADPFDPSDPIGTPRGLASAPLVGADPVLQALGQAVLRLEGAGVPLDASLREVQYLSVGGGGASVPGGRSAHGTLAVAEWADLGDSSLLAGTGRPTVLHEPSGLTTDGYPVNFGNSWLMAVEFTGGTPHARAVMTTGQSSDPTSPHYADQALVYAEERLRPVLFTESEILADQGLEVVTVSATVVSAPPTPAR